MSGNLKTVVMRVSEGHQGAFKELFDTFSPKTYGFALKLTHSPSMSEEIVQEVFLKIWLNRKALRNVEHFPAWLYSITRNLAFNVLKRSAIEQRVKAQFVKELREENFETEESVIYRDYQRILNKAIDRLSPQQKMVYGLCYGDGLKYEQAAEKLRISKFTVKTHMQQAIRKIKSQLGYIIPGLVSLFC